MFYGYARGFFQSLADDGPIQITAASILGDTLFEQSQQIAIDVQCVRLRGAQNNRGHEIRYTTDGSDPETGEAYDKPFLISDTTQVKAVVLQDGKSVMHLSQEFIKGVRPKVSDPRWADSFQENSWGATGKGYPGPFDPEVVGLWQSGEKVFDFRPDGVVIKNPNSPQQKKVAYWCYDFPNDKFEAGQDAGSGEINWLLSANSLSELKLESQAANVLKIKRGKKKMVLKRVTKEAPP